MEDTEFLNEVERGWHMFSEPWQQAARVGQLSAKILETQRGWYYAATHHAIALLAKAAEQELLKDPQHGAAHLATRYRQMLDAIALQAAIAGRRRASHPAASPTNRMRRLWRAAAVGPGLSRD